MKLWNSRGSVNETGFHSSQDCRTNVPRKRDFQERKISRSFRDVNAAFRLAAITPAAGARVFAGLRARGAW
ncbi:MAG: hypothetical protein JZU55_01395, partial [Afipia sp.]|nr:hypothetical protein [Afipia sp.]